MSFDLSSSFPHFKIPMAEGGKHSVYEFDSFKLDAENLMLYHGADEISLPPKVVKTLAVLIENGGSIISKDELIDQVWTDSIVEEASLSQHLYLLRKTLGNKPDGRPYIETLRRRGYRFTGDVKVTPNGGAAVKTRVEPDVRPPLDVEREGNVLRLVDWKPAPDVDPAAAPAIPEPPETERRTWSAVLPLIAAFLLIAIGGVAGIIVFRRDQPVQTVTERSPEMSMTRLTNGVMAQNVAIAPDGNDFVYDESDGESARVWLQQVGESGRVEIASSSTQHYHGKTFSPDGRFVYVVAQEKNGGDFALYRVPAMGGPLTKVLDGVLTPVSFSPEGNEMAMLTIDRDKGVSRLLIADKDARSPRVVRETHSPQMIVGGPSWSPDGRSIAFAESDATGSTVQATVSIFAIDPSDNSVRRLTDELWDTVYRIEWTRTGDGFLMIATRGNEGWSTRRDQLYFVSYPTGESRRLTNDGNRHQAWSLSVTKDDAAVVAPISRPSQIWSIGIASKGESDAVQISTGASDGRAGLAPLPDGRLGYIARTGELVHVWIMNGDGSGAKQLTSEPPILEELRADPQGRYFVFSAPLGKQSHLFRVDIGGGGLRQVTFGEGNEVDSTVSPDGNWIIYSSFVLRDRFRSELWKVSIDGGEPTRFSDVECSSPLFSPDGSLVSCVREEKEIFVLSAADGKVLENYNLPPTSTVNFGAGWTPDGRALTFIRTVKADSNVWRQPRKGGPPAMLTNFTSGYLMRYAYSADGSRLFVARGFPTQDPILIRGFK